MDTTQSMNLSINDSPTTDRIMYGKGILAGEWIKNNFSNIIMGIIIFVMIWFLVNIYNDMDKIEDSGSILKNANVYMGAVYHQGCKSKGACCKTCPYITEDDPRLILYKQTQQINTLYDQTKDSIKQDQMMALTATEKITDSSKQSTKSTEWNSIISTQKMASDSIGLILNQLKDLDRQYGEQSSINTELIDAKNRATALGASAVIYKNVFVVSSLHLNSQIMLQYILDVAPEKQQKINGYDQKVISASMAANTSSESISKQYNQISSSINGSIFLDAYNAVSTGTTTSQDIIKHMATLLNMAQSGTDSIEIVVYKLNQINEAYQSCYQIMESFSNDLPGKLPADKMLSLIEANDYESAIIQTALEPDLVPNHRKFAKERQTFESGGGIQSVFDHNNDINPWVGLFGRPTYRRSDGSSVENNDKEPAYTNVLKSIPSQSPDQYMNTSNVGFKTHQWVK